MEKNNWTNETLEVIQIRERMIEEMVNGFSQQECNMLAQGPDGARALINLICYITENKSTAIADVKIDSNAIVREVVERCIARGTKTGSTPAQRNDND